MIHAKKFQLVNWVPAKLGHLFVTLTLDTDSNTIITEIPLILPEGDVLEFGEKHLGRGVVPGEEELPEDKPSGSKLASSYTPSI